MEINIKVVSDGCVLPRYETPGASAMDIRADLSKDRRAKPFPSCDRGPCLVIYPGSTELIQTGFAIEIPIGYEVQIRPRSGLSRKGLVVANSPGTVDSDYRGEVMVMVHNRSKDPFYMYHGDRIAQMVVSPVEYVTWKPVEELSDTTRGSGGFGSTGTT